MGSEQLFLSDFPLGGMELGETRGKKGVCVGRKEPMGWGGGGATGSQSGVKQSRVDAVGV